MVGAAGVGTGDDIGGGCGDGYVATAGDRSGGTLQAAAFVANGNQRRVCLLYTSGAGRANCGEYRGDNRAARVARTARAAVSEFRAAAKISRLKNRKNSFSSKRSQ